MEIMIHALIDSLKVFAAVFVFHIIFSFIENKISKVMNNKNGVSPLIGAAFGLVPQCGFSVLAADMYLKEHITMGTLLAVFITCSDEALPMMLSDFSKIHLIIPMIIVKFVIGFITGFIIDLIVRKNKEKVHDHLHHCEHEQEIHIGCCNHEIDNEHANKWKEHLLHPLFHSLKIFLYVFIVNLIFGGIVHLVGEQNFANFLADAKYFGPLFSVIVGLIPNCASSVIITELLLMGNISFGTALAGLIVNCGLGSIVLFKKKGQLKNNLIIFTILISIALVVGYLTCFIFGF